VRGIDVSAAQGAVNWGAVRRAGARFAYIKATEGTYYTNPDFSQQYGGAFRAGIIRGAYAFAIPNFSSGAAQANYLVNHGGGWSADGMTLPAALDIEYNPYRGTECYNLGQSAMRSWVNAFLNQYHSRTGRWPTIYTTTDWWSTCTGNWSGPSSKDPLWIARYGVRSPGALLAGYRTYTIWQFQAAGSLPGDQDWFNGSFTRLQALAKNN